MTSLDIQRLRWIHQQIKQVEHSPRLDVAVDPALVKSFLRSEVNEERILLETKERQERFHVDIEFEVSDEEIALVLGELRGKFDQQHFDEFIASARDTVIDSLLKPFLLSKALFDDVDGGNIKITTSGMANRGLFATEQDKSNFEEGYLRKKYVRSHQQTKNRGKLNFSHRVTDAYTDKRLKDYELDHVVSAKEFHTNDDVRLHLTHEQRKRILNSRDNLRPTSPSINASKREKPIKEWSQKQSSDRDGKTNQEKYNIDPDKADAADRQARTKITREIRQIKIKKYTKEIVSTGANEGLKMGAQQALGLMLRELIIGIFAEVKDIYQNGMENGDINKSFFDALKERATRILNRVLARWKDALQAFGEGFVSGFLSNLVTWIINWFVKTTSNVVRMIREGFFSLLKAIKMLLFPPEGMTSKQAAHAATKLISSGLITIGGIALEEALGKFCANFGPIAPFAEGIVSFGVGLITGLGTVLTVYLLDRWDLFGVNAEVRQEFVMLNLRKRLDDALMATEDLELELTPLFL